MNGGQTSLRSPRQPTCSDFRCIPGLAITTDHILVCEDGRFEITSVEGCERQRDVYGGACEKGGGNQWLKWISKCQRSFCSVSHGLALDFDPVAEKMLEAGGEIVLAKAQSNLSSVIGNGTKYESRSTGNWSRRLVCPL